MPGLVVSKILLWVSTDKNNHPQQTSFPFPPNNNSILLDHARDAFKVTKRWIYIGAAPRGGGVVVWAESVLNWGRVSGGSEYVQLWGACGCVGA